MTSLQYQKLNEELLHAASEGNTSTVEALLVQGADVNATDNVGNTALMKAILHDCDAVVEGLLKQDVNINATNQDGATALMLVAWKGLAYIVELLLNQGADVNASRKDGWTALMYAAEEGHDDVVEILLKHGAEVNAANNNGGTALIRASIHGQGNVVEVLLKRGSDLNIADHYGNTALLWAASKGKFDIFEVFVKKGAEINAVDNDGNTALIIAAKDGHVEIVELLLRHGAEVNAINKEGYTALQVAVNFIISDFIIKAMERYLIAVIDMLVKHGANVNAADKNGMTVLMNASFKGHVQLVELLLKQQADVDTADKDGFTALMHASVSDFPTIVEVLLKYGADVNNHGNNGWTALMFAANQGHVTVVERLLRQGADWNVVNKNGKTALMLAQDKGYELLINDQSDNALNSYGRIVELLQAKPHDKDGRKAGENADFDVSIRENFDWLQPGELGVLFDIESLGSSSYGDKAWAIVMNSLDPQKLAGCRFFCGDIGIPGKSSPSSFCIGIDSMEKNREQLEYFAKSFSGDYPALLPHERRFVQGQLSSTLLTFGHVDNLGRFAVADRVAFNIFQIASSCGWKAIPSDRWLGAFAVEITIQTRSNAFLGWDGEFANVLREGLLEVGQQKITDTFQQLPEKVSGENKQAVLKELIDKLWPESQEGLLGGSGEKTQGEHNLGTINNNSPSVEHNKETNKDPAIPQTDGISGSIDGNKKKWWQFWK